MKALVILKGYCYILNSRLARRQLVMFLRSRGALQKMDLNSYLLSRRLGFALKAKGLRLAAAESCTGGEFCRIITCVPGSSAWFNCGFVTYSNQSKIKFLGVNCELIEKEGAVSEAVACEMALGVLERSDADIAVSITGVAGPSGGEKEKPVGTVWIAIARKNAFIECRKVFFESGRRHVRDSSIDYALKWLVELVENR